MKHFCRIACLLLAVSLSSLSAARADQTGNLIANPGAETGDLTGWVDALGNGYNVSTTVMNSGLYSFWGGITGPGNSSWTNEIRQDVDVAPYASIIDAGTMTADFEAWGRSNQAGTATDNGSLVVEYRSGASVLGSFSSGNFSPTNTWVQVTDSRIVPVGTRTIRIRLQAQRAGGASSDGGQDDLSLKLESPVLGVPTVPRRFALGSVHPNPSLTSSELELTLEHPLWVELSVFDVRGRHVRSLIMDRLDSGNFRISWNGRDRDERPVAPGLCFYSGRVGDVNVSRRAVVIR